MNYAYTNAKDIYKKNQVSTAPKKKLLIMLYDGAIKNLNLAEQALEGKNNEIVNTNIIKAQNIVMELSFTLNFDAGGEIADNLYKLYDYMYLRLVRANIDKDMDGVKEVKRLLEELRETWSKI